MHSANIQKLPVKPKRPVTKLKKQRYRIQKQAKAFKQAKRTLKFM